MRPWIVGSCISALLLLPCLAARADEEKVALDKLPRAVLEVVKKKFPKASLVSASKEVKDKKTLYEVTIKDGEQNIQVTVTPEGEATEVEKEIAAKDLPTDVAAALDTRYPKATIKKAEEVASGKDLKEVAYEVVLVTKDRKTVEVKFDPKGKVLKTEEKHGEEAKGEKKEKKGEGKKGKEDDEEVEQKGQNKE